MAGAIKGSERNEVFCDYSRGALSAAQCHRGSFLRYTSHFNQRGRY